MRRTRTRVVIGLVVVLALVVAGAVWLLAGWLPRVPRLILMLLAIGLYLLLVGPLPALVRAAEARRRGWRSPRRDPNRAPAWLPHPAWRHMPLPGRV